MEHRPSPLPVVSGKPGPERQPKIRGNTKQTRKLGTIGKIDAAVLTVIPLYVFTLLFVAGPLVYMVILSFLKRAEIWGVVHEFTLSNYRNILEPIYLKTFWESLKLAGPNHVAGHLNRLSFGYFMAKLTAEWKHKVMLLLMIPFWTSSLIRLYGWIIIFRANGTLDRLLMGLRSLTPRSNCCIPMLLLQSEWFTPWSRS